MKTFTYAAHVAYLDPMTGNGVLVLPPPLSDIRDPFSPGSLHSADWDRAIAHLDSIGFEPSEGDNGDIASVGFTADGREVIGLFGREPIISGADLCEEIAAWNALMAVAGIGTQA